MMFDESIMDQLSFLEGRWSGTAPDGSSFYEIYDRPDKVTFRSRRFDDDTFSKSTDSSLVAFENGEVTSTWGEYKWKASCIEDGKASFEPVNAPSSFSWQRVDTDTVSVTQNWTDDQGAAQSYSLKLLRIGR